MRHLTAVGRVLRQHRRTVAAALAALGVLAIVQSLSPEPEPTAPVVVAAGRLTGGHRLAEGDLAIVDLPVALVPDAAVADPADLFGQTLTATTSRGAPVTTVAVLGPDTLAPDRALAPVRFADPDLARVIEVGDRIDIVAAGADVGPSAVIVADVRVVTIPQADEGAGFGGGTGDGLLILVEVTPEDAAALAQISGQAVLSPVLRG